MSTQVDQTRQREARSGKRAMPYLFAQLVAANLVVTGLVALVLYLTFQRLTEGYFDRLMIEFQISPTKLNAMFVEDVERGLFWGIGVAVVVGIALSLFLTNAVLRPLYKMGRASETIASGDFSARAPEMAGELGAIARSFNAMAHSLEQEEERRRQLLRDLSHEIRTPLTNLKGYLEALSDGVFEARPEVFDVLRGEADRLNALVDDLSSLAAAEGADNTLEPQPVDLEAAVNQALAAHRHALIERDLTIKVSTEGTEVPVRADPKRLDQVLNNAVANMVQYARADAGGPAVGSVSLRFDGTGSAELVFENTSDNIDLDDFDRLFDRFYRADPSRAGRGGSGHNAGLGLSILRRLVEAHGGTARAEQVGGAFRLIVTWPTA